MSNFCLTQGQFKGFSNTLPPKLPMSSPRDKIASGLPAIADKKILRGTFTLFTDDLECS